MLSLFLSPVTGDIADHIGPRPVMAAGAVLMGAGLILTARVHYFPLIFLTYGLGAGGAVACVYVPSIAAVGSGSNFAGTLPWASQSVESVVELWSPLRLPQC